MASYVEAGRVLGGFGQGGKKQLLVQSRARAGGVFTLSF